MFLCLNHGLHADVNGQGDAGDENARNANKKAPPAAAAKPEVPDAGGNAGEPDGSDSDDSDDLMWSQVALMVYVVPPRTTMASALPICCQRLSTASEIHQVLMNGATAYAMCTIIFA